MGLAYQQEEDDELIQLANSVADTPWEKIQETLNSTTDESLRSFEQQKKATLLQLAFYTHDDGDINNNSEMTPHSNINNERNGAWLRNMKLLTKELIGRQYNLHQLGFGFISLAHSIISHLRRLPYVCGARREVTEFFTFLINLDEFDVNKICNSIDSAVPLDAALLTANKLCIQLLLEAGVDGTLVTCLDINVVAYYFWKDNVNSGELVNLFQLLHDAGVNFFDNIKMRKYDGVEIAALPAPADLLWGYLANNYDEEHKAIRVDFAQWFNQVHSNPKTLLAQARIRLRSIYGSRVRNMVKNVDGERNPFLPTTLAEYVLFK